MRERGEMRETFVLERGLYDAPTDVRVERAVPVSLALAEKPVEDRLALADWLVDAAHPLTARVAVNRLWSMCFGQGLVATEEDFGSQGDLPLASRTASTGSRSTSSSRAGT